MDSWWVVYFDDGKEVGRAVFTSEALAQKAAESWHSGQPQRRSTQSGPGEAPGAQLYLTQTK